MSHLLHRSTTQDSKKPKPRTSMPRTQLPRSSKRVKARPSKKEKKRTTRTPLTSTTLRTLLPVGSNAFRLRETKRSTYLTRRAISTTCRESSLVLLMVTLMSHSNKRRCD